MQYSLARAAITAAAAAEVAVVVVMVVIVVLVVARKDLCLVATELPIGVPCPGAWIILLELISQAGGDRVTGGSGGSHGSGGSFGNIGKGHLSLARAVVCVVMGAFGKVSLTQNLFMGASFTSRCHHTALHGNLFLLTPT